MLIIRAFVVAGIVSAWLAMPSTATASAVLDQQVLPGQPFATAGDFGFGSSGTPQGSGGAFRFPVQTFTAGLSGHLVGLDLYVQNRIASGDLRFELLGNNDGANTYEASRILVSKFISEAVVPDYPDPILSLSLFFYLDLAEFNLFVTAGDQFAIVLSDFDNRGNNNEPFVWSANTGDPYSSGFGTFIPYREDGGHWQDAEGFDLAFRSYVAVIPEPSSLAIFLIPFLAVAWQVHPRFRLATATPRAVGACI